MTLTPQARAIAAIVLATTVIMGGWFTGGRALVLVLGIDDVRLAGLFGALVPLVVAVLAYFLARDVSGAGGWELHVAGAARVVAAAAFVLSALVLVAGLVGTGSLFF